MIPRPGKARALFHPFLLIRQGNELAFGHAVDVAKLHQHRVDAQRLQAANGFLVQTHGQGRATWVAKALKRLAAPWARRSKKNQASTLSKITRASSNTASSIVRGNRKRSTLP